MFSWLKGRKGRDREFLEGLMRAAAEGQSRSQVNRALGSVGIQLKPEPDNAQYCIKATAAIVRLIAEKAGVPIQSMNHNDRFVAGIFSFVTSNHLTRIVGAPFETVASIIPIDLFGLDYADQVSALGDSYNRMATEGQVVEAIGQNIAKWISNPTDEQLNKLVSLFELCRDYA